MPAKPELAVVVLHDAIEEDGEESSVHETRWPLVGDGERHRSLGPVTVDLNGVLGDARVVGTDVEGMIEVHSSRRRTRRRPPGAPSRPVPRRRRAASHRSRSAMRRSTSSSSFSSARVKLVTRRNDAARGSSVAAGRHRRSSAATRSLPLGRSSEVEERVDCEEVDLAGLRAGQALYAGGSRWAIRSGPGPRTGTTRRSSVDTGSAPGRSSTTATGTAPRRRSSRLTTAAPRTAGCRSSAALMSSGRTLNPPRMIAWSARPSMKRNPPRPTGPGRSCGPRRRCPTAPP